MEVRQGVGKSILFQFKHCTIIRKQTKLYERVKSLFQFKHCTIIRDVRQLLQAGFNHISIQALYDYKLSSLSRSSRYLLISIQALYDYKSRQTRVSTCLQAISIQALYDYKFYGRMHEGRSVSFQFKHCTIIRKIKEDEDLQSTDFNSSIVRL